MPHVPGTSWEARGSTQTAELCRQRATGRCDGVQHVVFYSTVSYATLFYCILLDFGIISYYYMILSYDQRTVLDFELMLYYMVVSQIGGPQYRPQNTIILIMGTPKMVPLILGNPHMIKEQPRYIRELRPELRSHGRRL